MPINICNIQCVYSHTRDICTGGLVGYLPTDRVKTNLKLFTVLTIEEYLVHRINVTFSLNL